MGSPAPNSIYFDFPINGTWNQKWNSRGHPLLPPPSAAGPLQFHLQYLASEKKMSCHPFPIPIFEVGLLTLPPLQSWKLAIRGFYKTPIDGKRLSAVQFGRPCSPARRDWACRCWECWDRRRFISSRRPTNCCQPMTKARTHLEGQTKGSCQRFKESLACHGFTSSTKGSCHKGRYRGLRLMIHGCS